MPKNIKTKEVVKDIKVHNSAVNLKGGVKDIGVKTKEKLSESINRNDTSTPEQYATDKITESVKSKAETTAIKTESTVKRGASIGKEKIKEKRAEKRVEKQVAKEDATDNFSENNDKGDNRTPDSKAKRDTNDINQSKDIAEKLKLNPNADEKTGIKESATEIKTVDHTVKGKQLPKDSKESVVEEKNVPRQRKQSAPKTREKPTVKKANENKLNYTVGSNSKKIKQTQRDNRLASKAVKEADNTVKTSQNTINAATATAKSATNIARKTEQAKNNVAKVSEKAVKAVSKAINDAGKSIVTGAKSVGAVIAAGGVLAVVMVIVICLIGAIGGTCFGIFLSNDETTGTEKTMSQAISELTSEHYANLAAMKTTYTYDLFEVKGNTAINWKDILAVYAVKTTSGDNPLEVVTLDEEKIKLLREIMKDMNTMTGVVTTKTVAETSVTTDKNGHSVKSTTYVTKKVLTVTIVQLSANQMAEIYKMNDEQKAQIKELTSSEYDALWNDLIGSGGQVISPNTSYIGTGMFVWPLDGDYTISSRFGTRTDPISGVVKTHGGTDIAAPMGTPILAAADGTVVIAGYNPGGYGFYVKLKHNDTYTTIYGHCSVLHVTTGQTVKQGQLIAEVGSTGYSTGPHLHYEVIQNGIRVDALRFYKIPY